MSEIVPAVPKNQNDLADFLVYLASRPTLKEVCNQMVFRWQSSYLIGDTCIGTIRPDGSLTFSGSFKYEAVDNHPHSAASIWDNLPPAIAVRDQQARVWVNRGEIEEQFSELAATMPHLSSVMAAPLMTRKTPYGVLVACSDEPLANPEEALAEFTELSLALSLYVFYILGVPELQPDASPPATRPIEVPRRRSLVPDQLSLRQLTVLDLVAQGHSNRSIGRLIGFSESTVRQETMVIYAFLGVSGRKEAVEVAIARNMVEITPDEAPPAP